MVAARVARLPPFPTLVPSPPLTPSSTPTPSPPFPRAALSGDMGGVGGASDTSPCGEITSLLGSMCPSTMPPSCCLASSAAHFPMTCRESRLSTICPLAFWSSSHCRNVMWCPCSKP